MRMTLALAAAGLVLSTIALAQSPTVAISSPADGARVPERPIVEGKVSDPATAVWIVIHPLDVSTYWVQPRVTVRAGGAWKVQVFVGRPGSLDVGKPFEVRAVANPQIELREGLKLDDWPKAAATSNVVEWVRR